MPLLSLLLGWYHPVAAMNNAADAVTTVFLLVSGLVVYRIFRERYLFFWIAGWCSFVCYRFFLAEAQRLGYAPASVFLTYIVFLVSSALFAISVFDYLERPTWFVVTGIATATAAVLTALRVFLFPHASALEACVQVLYRASEFAAAVQLILFSRGRRQISPWLMAAMLLLVHIDFDIARPREHENLDMLLETLLGLSMLVLVLEESAARNRRLKFVNDLTSATDSATDENAAMTVALTQIKAFMHAKAAWFRLLSGGVLELQARVGLSHDFHEYWPTVPSNDAIRGPVLQTDSPRVMTRANGDDIIRGIFDKEGFAQMLVIPLRGKTAVIGLLAIGIDRPRQYRRAELQFITSITLQLGVAIENQRLITKILRSQKQWANTFDALPDPIFVHDEKFSIINMNRALLNKIGSSLDAVRNRTCEQVLPDFGSTWVGCPYCPAQGSEFRDAPDPCFGGYSIVSTTSYSADDTGQLGLVHIIRDTTARRAAEERYRTLFEQVQEGVFISTPDGRVVDCNDTFVQLLGYDSRDDVLSRDIAQSFYADPADRNIFLQRMAKEGMVRNFEVKLRRRDGSAIIVLENSYATRTASGKLIRYHGVLLDITEQKRAEQEIRRRNRELEALNTIAVLASQSFDLDEIVNLVLRNLVDVFRAHTAAIFLLEPETRKLRRCAAYGHQSEVGAEFQIGEEMWNRIINFHLEILTDRDLAQLPSQVARFVEAERLRSWIWVVMWSGEKMIGMLGVSSREEAWFSDRDAGLLIALGRQLANSIEKVKLYEETSKAYDNLRRTQEQLLQSEKMSAVGQLISGVAHELNNPLTAILGYAQLLEGEALSDHAKEFVSKLFKQAQRTQRVVQNLLSFARQHKPSRMPVDVRRIVEDTLALRDYDLKLHNIAIDRTFAHTIPAVVADSHQLEQVFLNIINNAVDAMLEQSRGGRLEVSITSVDGQVVVRVRDTGPGIKELNRVFDPFYTTKAVGKGTGLGLSICYGILKEHGGDIRAFNHPDGGAVLEVLLPVAGADVVLPQVASAPERNVPLQGRVLLVDDEEAVLDFEREVLRGAGAEVVTAMSVERALSILGREDFDAILIDSYMPGALNSMDLYNWVEQNRPEYKHRVLMAFSSAESDLKTVVEEKGMASITKPFEVSSLIAAMAKVIQRWKSAATV
ncbi:MAG TPA: ATP-binding protein [Terriglobales bacterium]|nr:ATP-binding protein [Terriglobales bacterium]